MKALFAKDIRQLWRTFRLPALLLSGLFFAILDPIGAKYMPQIMEKLMSGSEGITIIMPEMGPADALISFFGNLAQMGAFIIIVTAMGAVANERERGISAWVPVSYTHLDVYKRQDTLRPWPVWPLHSEAAQ